MKQTPSFSQRRGFKPVKNQLQIDSMDDDLRNGLWNNLELFLWNRLSQYAGDNLLTGVRSKGDIFFEKLWVLFFKRSLTTLHPNWQDNLKRLQIEYGNWAWNEVYDFIEFAAQHFPGYDRETFRKVCNGVLERELSAYRFVDNILVPITSEEEIAAIQEASAISDPFRPASLHIESALRLLADRKAPDYRNSIKESISAAESICKLITGDEKATLSTALKKVEGQHGLHGSLKNALNSLYGYTSDADGIRHALLEDSKADFDDAKFMLISCSAFVTYLVSKAAKTGK